MESNNEELIEISFKLPKEQYQIFKCLCRIKKIEPQDKIRSLMEEVISAVGIDNF